MVAAVLTYRGVRGKGRLRDRIVLTMLRMAALGLVLVTAEGTTWPLVLLWIARRPWWWLILWLIPLVNIVIAIIVSVDIAQNFGKRTGFGIGLLLLPFIFYPILAWGSATYRPAPAAEAG